LRRFRKSFLVKGKKRWLSAPLSTAAPSPASCRRHKIDLGARHALSKLLENMNPQQQDGIRSVDGPVLLLAGAGSGKTRVITHRIAYLIEERGPPPDAILAATFTNKAAKEMAERVEKILGHSTLAQPTATFHSFSAWSCAATSKPSAPTVGLTRTFAIYDETDSRLPSSRPSSASASTTSSLSLRRAGHISGPRTT
jgi:DNA helicase-2/ATP-dependent DNA helicase PcrA